MSRFRQFCYFPSLIIAIAAPWMCVLGVVYLDCVVVQPLSEYIWLGHHLQQDRCLAQVTRALNALAISIDKLKVYYESQRDRGFDRPPTLIDAVWFLASGR